MKKFNTLVSENDAVNKELIEINSKREKLYKSRNELSWEEKAGKLPELSVFVSAEPHKENELNYLFQIEANDETLNEITYDQIIALKKVLNKLF